MSEFYSAKEVADRLGVHSTTVTRMVQRGDLQGHRIGKLTRIPVRAYEDYIEQTRITPTPSKHKGPASDASNSIRIC